MKLIEPIVRMRISEALGWTIFHSVWEGILIAAALAVLLACVRAPRIRYAAGCAALLAMAASFAITFIHILSELIPERGGGAQKLIYSALPSLKEIPNMNGSDAQLAGFAVLMPWLGFLWLAGVCLFYLHCARAGSPLIDGGAEGFAKPQSCGDKHSRA